MRFQIVKEIMADGFVRFYIRKKDFLFWEKVKSYKNSHSGEILYFTDLMDAQIKVCEYVDKELSKTKLESEVVWDSFTKEGD
jgi:hypothetical protein